jgi:hypothetical protein
VEGNARKVFIPSQTLSPHAGQNLPKQNQIERSKQAQALMHLDDRGSARDEEGALDLALQCVQRLARLTQLDGKDYKRKMVVCDKDTTQRETKWKPESSSKKSSE